MLELRGISTFYGRAQILFDISLTARSGEAVALLGRNGAGKTTTLRSVMGLARPQSGQVIFGGHDVTRLPPHEIARLGLGWVPEDRRIFADLSVAENLEVGRREAREELPAWSRERLFRLFPKLAELQDRRGGNLSGGEQQMLAIARTLMGNPRALLLDEPSEGLAPVVVEQLAEAIVEIKTQGVAILISEQNWAFAAAIADTAYILEKGHIRAKRAMAELQQDPALLQSYLGL